MTSSAMRLSSSLFLSTACPVSLQLVLVWLMLTLFLLMVCWSLADCIACCMRQHRPAVFSSQSAAQALGSVFRYTPQGSTVTTPSGEVIPVVDLPDGRYGLAVLPRRCRRGQRVPVAGPAAGPAAVPAFHAGRTPTSKLRPADAQRLRDAWLLDGGASS